MKDLIRKFLYRLLFNSSQRSILYYALFFDQIKQLEQLNKWNESGVVSDTRRLLILKIAESKEIARFLIACDK